MMVVALSALFGVLTLWRHVGSSSWVEPHGPIRFGAVPCALAIFIKGIAACWEWYSKSSLHDVSVLAAVIIKSVKHSKSERPDAM